MYSIIEIEKHKETILQRIATGESLLQICRDKTIPGNDVVYKWLNSDAQFKDDYTHARQKQALFYVEKIENVIDNLKTSSEKSRENTDIARLEIDSYKWIASKLLPKVFGNAATQTNIQVNVTPVTGMQIVNEIEEEATE